jgi:hypothetical protein
MTEKAYYCSICDKTHRLASKIGQEHYQAMLDELSKPKAPEKPLSQDEITQKLHSLIFGGSSL